MSKTEAKQVRDTMDKMAMALADHAHIWKPDERRGYERAQVGLRREVGGKEGA